VDVDVERVRELTGKGPALILMHTQADPDALASAYLISRLFRDSTIGSYGDLANTAKEMASDLGIEYAIDPDPDGFDVIVVVDASTPEMLTPDRKIEPDLVIDHHRPQDGWKDAVHVEDEDRPSCVEVVLEIMSAMDIPLTGSDARIALAGILADTARFRFADAQTLRTAADLIDTGGNIPGALALVESDHYFDVSRRIALLKALQRTSVERTGDILIARSRISAYEAGAARILIHAGADVALVLSNKKNGGGRISARARPDAVDRDLHLGMILEEVGAEVGGWGGGHAGAAGLNAPEERIGEALEACVRRVKEHFNGAEVKEDDDETA